MYFFPIQTIHIIRYLVILLSKIIFTYSDTIIMTANTAEKKIGTFLDGKLLAQKSAINTLRN